MKRRGPPWILEDKEVSKKGVTIPSRRGKHQTVAAHEGNAPRPKNWGGLVALRRVALLVEGIDQRAVKLITLLYFMLRGLYLSIQSK